MESTHPKLENSEIRPCSWHKESKQYTETLVQDKTVKVKLLRKDQYGRVVAKVSVRPAIPFLPRKDLSLELAKKGLATLYTVAARSMMGRRKRWSRQFRQRKNASWGSFPMGRQMWLHPHSTNRKSRRIIKIIITGGNEKGCLLLRWSIDFYIII